MNKAKLIILLTFIASSLIAAEKVLDYLKASSNGSSVVVQWKSASEEGVEKYEIQRASEDKNFFKIGEKDAKGYPCEYKFVDENAYKKNEDGKTILNGKTFFYRIKIIRDDGTSELSDETSVIHNPSGIKRTWGMLKEMFR